MANRGLNRELMRRMQELQAQLAKTQQRLEETRVEASAGGGAVTVVMTARPGIESVSIKPDVVDPADVEMLQDMVMAAVNEALEKVRAVQSEQLAGGIDLPGLAP
jgi:DNA-binding YbaB/EbfC family protein